MTLKEQLIADSIKGIEQLIRKEKENHHVGHQFNRDGDNGWDCAFIKDATKDCDCDWQEFEDALVVKITSSIQTAVWQAIERTVAAIMLEKDVNSKYYESHRANCETIACRMCGFAEREEKLINDQLKLKSAVLGTEGE